MPSRTCRGRRGRSRASSTALPVEREGDAAQRRGELLVRRARHEQHAVHVAHIRDGHGAQILAGDAQGHPGPRLDLFALGAVVGQHLDVDPLVAAVGGVLDRRARERDALEGDVRDLAVVADAGDHRDGVRAVAPHHGQVGLARQRAHGHVADRYVLARAAQPRREAGVEVLDRERLGVGRGAGGTEAEREDRGAARCPRRTGRRPDRTRSPPLTRCRVFRPPTRGLRTLLPLHCSLIAPSRAVRCLSLREGSTPGRRLRLRANAGEGRAGGGLSGGGWPRGSAYSCTAGPRRTACTRGTSPCAPCG